MDSIKDVTNTVTEKAKEAGSSVSHTLRDNPLPAVLIGLGLGLLVAGGTTAARGTRQQSDDSWSSGDSAGGYQGYQTSPGQYASRYGGSSASGQEQGQGSESGSLLRWIEEQPLVVGLAAAVAGLAVGLGMPGSRYENRVLGEVGEDVRARAKDLVRDASETVKTKAQDLREKAQEQVEARMDDVKKASKDMSQEAKTAAKDAADSARDAAKPQGQSEKGQGQNKA